MRRFLAISSLLAISLAACSGTQQAENDVIKIGFVGPLTGDAAAIGADMLNGAKMAVAEANAAAGEDGVQYQLVAEDGKCAGGDSATAAQKLVNVDGVSVIVGGLCSSETLAIAPIAEAAQVVVLSTGSSSPDVTDAGDIIFRNYPSDALKTQAMAAYFQEEGLEKVAIISENTDFAQAFRTALVANLPEGAVVFDETVEPGTKDFRTLLTRLNDVDFDVFFPNPNGDAVMAVMVQQFREQGFTQPMVAHDVADSVSIGQIAGDAAEGFRLINVPSSGEGSAFETQYAQEFGDPQSSIAWAAHSYDATNVLIDALQNGGRDGPAVRDYLYNLSAHDGVIGSFSFDANGDVLGVPYVLKEHQSGAVVTLRPISVQ